MDIKISYIIPVYNVQTFLQECINSIASQTYSNIEIILVDDGSTDQSGFICDKNKDLDKRIKVIHKENGGLSDARNTGLLHATGDYVIFLDGDDFWINYNSLEKLVDVVEQNQECDFIGFNCAYFYTKDLRYKYITGLPTHLSCATDHNLAIVSLIQTGTFPMSACLKIIKREFIINKQLYFKKGITAEDIPWFINLMEKSQKVMFLNEYIYAYRQNVTNSITNTFSTVKFENLFQIIKNEITYLESRNLDTAAKNGLLSFFAYEYCILLGNFAFLDTKERKRLSFEFKGYAWLLRYTLNPKVKLTSFIYRLVGFKTTVYILSKYLKRK